MAKRQICVPRRAAVELIKVEHAFRRLKVQRDGDGPCGNYWKRAERAAEDAVADFRKGRDRAGMRKIQRIIRALSAGARCESKNGEA